MEALRQYLLSVTAAAVIASIAVRLLPKEGTIASVGKMVAGLFVALTVMAPIARLEFSQMADLTSGLQQEAQAAVQEGKDNTNLALQEIIKSKSEAYILDKARDFRLNITVSVKVSGDDLPVPVAVELKGSASPYAKQRLESIITEDLGILKENQVWI